MGFLLRDVLYDGPPTPSNQDDAEIDGPGGPSYQFSALRVEMINDQIAHFAG